MSTSIPVLLVTKQNALLFRQNLTPTKVDKQRFFDY